MKVLRACVVFLGLFLSLSEAVFYHFVKVENCTSSNQEFVMIKTCTASKENGVNLDVNITKPIEKLLVSFIGF
jgi:hypothetical protein